MSKFHLGVEARQTKAALESGNYSPPAVVAIDPRKPDAIRREMYTLSAVIGGDMVTQMQDRQIAGPPYFGLTDREGTPYARMRSYDDDIHYAMEDTVHHFINRQYELPEVYRPGFERLSNVLAAVYKVFPEVQHLGQGPRGFIQAGMATAVSQSVGAHAGIEALLKTTGNDISRERFRELAGKSMNLVYPIATDNIAHLQPYQNAIALINEENSVLPPYKYDARLLKLTHDINDPRAKVDFIKSPDQFIDPETGQKIGEIALFSETLTCPGTVKFPDVDVATTVMWNWTSDIVADTRYR